jgi:hypothetical protein
MKPIITKHAKKRLKERLGLSKRAHIRHIQSVLKKGTYLFRNIFDNKFYMQMNGKEYIFSWTTKLQPILITVTYTYSNRHKY